VRLRGWRGGGAQQGAEVGLGLLEPARHLALACVQCTRARMHWERRAACALPGSAMGVDCAGDLVRVTAWGTVSLTAGDSMGDCVINCG